MTDHLSTAPEASDTVDLHVPLPEIWSYFDLGADGRSEATAELAGMLAGKVDDPEAVAAESVTEFLDKVGGGSAPIMLASLRVEMDDGSLLAATMMVTRNDLGASLEPWRAAYADSVDVTVNEAAALRTFEQVHTQVGDLFEGPLTIVAWRYVVPMDDHSVLLFTFSSPNAELAEELLEHFEDIMSEVRVDS